MLTEEEKRQNDLDNNAYDDLLRGNEYGPVGETKDEDHDEAMYWWLSAAEKGNAEAQLQVGLEYTYQYDQLEDVDYVKAEYWLKKSAEQGNSEAQHELACIYEYGGDQVKVDLDKALFWYKRLEKTTSNILLRLVLD